MYDSRFTTPDIKFDGDEVSVNSLTDTTLHLLAQRAPTILYSLNGDRRKNFLAYLEKYKIVGPVDILLKAILKQEKTEEGTIIKATSIKLVDLIGEDAIKNIQMPRKGGLGRDQLLPLIQKMFFSEKSSFAQSGIFASCTASGTDKPVYNSIDEILEAKIDLLVGLTVDNKEHPFLWDIIKKFKGEVGRLLAAPRKIIRFNEGGNEKKIGVYEDIEGNPDVEVVLGDKSQRYESPKIDANSGAIIVPLCPSRIKDGDNWIPAENIKFYAIEEPVVQQVVNGGSRKALKERHDDILKQTDMLKPGETRIMEIPIDIGPYDADIEVVCVDGDGKPLNVIHFPATYLDAVRTFADGENRMQVEIKNMGTEPVMFKDIHFRVKLFETDEITREKFQLRRKIQEGEKKGFYPLEHLTYTAVLHGKGEGDLSNHTQGLGDLSNLDNLFPHETGLLFSQKELKGKKIDSCCVVNQNEPTLGLEGVEVGQEINEKDTRAIPSGYLRDFISITKKACSIGREKRVIFACRNNITKEEIEFLIDKHKITDIVSIPGHDGAGKASLDLVTVCQKFGVKLTSIEIKSHEAGKEIVYDMVGGKRPK